MAQSAVSPVLSPPKVASLPIQAILPWAAFFGILMLVLLYFVGTEGGALAVFSGTNVHEWVHDSRHLLGFPCH